MIRTTIGLEDILYKQARKKAIDQRIAFSHVVNRALEAYLQAPNPTKPKKFTLKVYKMGTVKGNLQRTQLYEQR